MDLKNIGGIVAGFVIAVVLLASVLVPVISSSLVTAGDKVVFTNDSAIVLREAEDGDVLQCTRATVDGVTSNTWTLNDEEISTIQGGALSFDVGLMSDGIYMNMWRTNGGGEYYDMTDETPVQTQFGLGTSDDPTAPGITTFTFSASTITVVDNLGNTVTADYTWAYVACPYNDGKYCAAVAGGVGYVSNDDEITLCGAYTSGSLDTMYYFHNDTTYVSNSAYQMTPSIEMEIAEGTTDIYSATVSVSMTDGEDTESFTPYRILVPYEVSGHADSGAMYSLLNIIPLLVTVGILMGIVTAVFVRRE